MAQSSFLDELRKIPPVTRFLCGSTLAVSLPVILQLASPYQLIFVKELVTQRFEIWRVFTSFFLGSSGINFIFDIAMLYRNSNSLESAHFSGRSADYAWQLFLACCAILSLNIPLQSYVHTRPLLLTLTYLSSSLAPPGAQSSFFGLVTIPAWYLPYVFIGLDLVMGGPKAAAQSITGVIAGHAWRWIVFDGGAGPAGRTAGNAPGWLRRFFGQSDRAGSVGSVGGRIGGVHVIPPRARTQVQPQTGGYQWGTGNRLGGSGLS